MERELDLSKPLRRSIENLPAEYRGKTPDGRYLVAYQSSLGTEWLSDVCSLSQLKERFENIPAPKPKLAGFIALHGDKRDRALGCNEAVFCENDDDDLRETTDSAYRYVTIIDLSKVNPEAIEWLDP